MPPRFARTGQKRWRSSARSAWRISKDALITSSAIFASRAGAEKLTGTFEAVVSAIAIHNAGSPEIIERIYRDIFPLVKSGGCFINFDRERPPLEDQMKWLRDAGFQDVQRFWTGETRALFGGFKK